MEENLVQRLYIRAQIRRQIPSRKSVQEGKPDRVADLLEEAAKRIEDLEQQLRTKDGVLGRTKEYHRG